MMFSTTKMIPGFLCALCLTLLTLISQPCPAQDELIVPVSSDNEITVTHLPSTGKYLLIWLAPEYGFSEGHSFLAQRLNELGIEIWQVNIVQSLFLPQTTQSIKQLDGHYIADLMEYAHQKTGKKIILAGDSYAASHALSGANQWQQRNQTSPYLIGAILFTPYTYAYVPALGKEPEYLPVISATNIPIMIYQTQKSSTFGRFNQLLEQLQEHSNAVYSKVMPDIMSQFYAEKLTPKMKQNTSALAPNIKNMITVLEKHDYPLAPVTLPGASKNEGGMDIFLKEFKGNTVPLAINLEDVHGNVIQKTDYKGKVTLINFWATWCPPCVEEIPSLNRLKQKMADQPFELISINYAEDTKDILEFMEKVDVNFPVLLDHEGAIAQKWQVLTFPSTFVIDTTGTIKYGVNAAIEWDSEQVIKHLKDLISHQ